MADVISSSDDLIDSRKVRERIGMLESLRALDEGDCGSDQYGELFTEDDDEELAKLHELAKQSESVYGWDDGVTLINESYWLEYAKDQAEDINGIDINEWPFDHINWDEAADALKVDYTTIEWDGETFYVR